MAVPKVDDFKLPLEDVAELKQHRRNLLDAMDKIPKAEECGIDCQNYRLSIERQIAQIDKIIEHYGS